MSVSAQIQIRENSTVSDLFLSIKLPHYVTQTKQCKYFPVNRTEYDCVYAKNYKVFSEVDFSSIQLDKDVNIFISKPVNLTSPSLRAYSDRVTVDIGEVINNGSQNETLSISIRAKITDGRKLIGPQYTFQANATFAVSINTDDEDVMDVQGNSTEGNSTTIVPIVVRRVPRRTVLSSSTLVVLGVDLIGAVTISPNHQVSAGQVISYTVVIQHSSISNYPANNLTVSIQRNTCILGSKCLVSGYTALL